MTMIELQQNRYLWVHFAALAAVPLLLDACLAGLASAGPAFGYPLAYGGQFWLIALVGVLPPLAMQWLRPFYIYSLPPLALKPTALTDNDRRRLQLFQSWQVKAMSLVGAGVAVWLLAQVYRRSPQVMPLMTPMAGLVITVVAFFFMSLFLQLAAGCGRAIFVSPGALKRVPAYEEGAIARDFLILGVPLNQLLPLPTISESKGPVEIDQAAEKDVETPPVAASSSVDASAKVAPVTVDTISDRSETAAFSFEETALDTLDFEAAPDPAEEDPAEEEPAEASEKGGSDAILQTSSDNIENYPEATGSENEVRDRIDSDAKGMDNWSDQ